mmetsp:Transcript_26737/g.68719  ORF Transcript_26737/g.68719 Transcript_26737/m.68719 type:complete len:452 (-) Transcript_26737:344-1699(-)
MEWLLSKLPFPRKSPLQSPPHLVIIGGGYAGIQLLRHVDFSLARVTLIDRKEFFDHNIASLRTLVRPSFIDETLYSYSDFLPSIAPSAKFVRGTVRDATKEKVVLEDGCEIEYDYLVFAVGSVTPSALTKCGTHIVTKEEREKELLEFSKCCRRAKHVVIVGGGSTGVELAAELALTKPEPGAEEEDSIDGVKETRAITLIHRGSRLLEYFSKRAGSKAERLLRERGVNILLSDSLLPEYSPPLYSTSTPTPSSPVAPPSYAFGDEPALVEPFSFVSPQSKLLERRMLTTMRGKKVMVDALFFCAGLTPCTFFLSSSSLLRTAIDEKGQIEVDNKFRVRGTVREGRVFAIGDCSNTKEGKLAFLARRQAVSLAKNLNKLFSVHSVSAASDRHAAAHTSNYSPLPVKVGVVTLGDRDGIVQLANVAVSGYPATFAKASTMMVEKMKREFKLH